MITRSMSRRSIGFDPALHADRESDARQVLDLVLYRQIGTFSALEIAQVADLMPSWISHNIGAITNARADETRDWYFPVYTCDAIPTHGSAPTSSSWSGIHHLAENQASATVHPLPTFPAVPPSWRISTIVACGGGLLLLMPPVYPVPSSEDGDVVRSCMTCGRVGSRHARSCSQSSNDGRRTKALLRYEQSKVPQDWKPLLVCNPFTQTWRELPEPAENRGSLKWRYDEVLIDMMVDEQANSYIIVMTFQNSFCMCVYTSASNTWAYHQYRPLARRDIALISDICAHAVVSGRLHFAFVEYRLDAPTLATLRVFEIKLETGEWKPWQEFALQVRIWGFLVRRFVNPLQGRIGREASEVLRYLGLVECMGDMYAVIPARREEVITLNDNNVAHLRAMANTHCSLEAGFESMPVQFHILGLNCKNTLDVHGVLQIHVPGDRNDIQLRRTLLTEKRSKFLNWFSCTAKGSVIWVTCEDYLLQYDVISGRTKTQIIPKPGLKDVEVSYRPSFLMKP